VYGTLDDSKLLEEESARAHIVLRKYLAWEAVLIANALYYSDTADSSDHGGAATAISRGLAAGHTKEKPGFWIHISGTGILTWKDSETKTYGEPPSQPPYDDLENVAGLTSLPDSAFHRDIDKIVLESASDSVKTAIVCPPTIYGPGRGPVNKRSRQVYHLARITLKLGKAPQVGRGLTVSPFPRSITSFALVLRVVHSLCACSHNDVPTPAICHTFKTILNGNYLGMGQRPRT
jgi:hypothetical protein